MERFWKSRIGMWIDPDRLPWTRMIPPVRRFGLVRRVRPGEMLPKWYGLAWHDYMRQEGVCAPVPVNVLLRITHAIWCALRAGLVPHWLDRHDLRLLQAQHDRRPVEESPPPIPSTSTGG